MLLVFIGSRLREAPLEPDIMESPTKACRLETSLRLSAAAWTYRSSPAVRRQPTISAGSGFLWYGRVSVIGANAGAAGWRPFQPGLIADLDAEHYFEHAAGAAL